MLLSFNNRPPHPTTLEIMNSMEINQQAQHEDEEACMFAMQLATACTLPMVLKVVIELDLLEAMAKAGPGAYVSPSELAAQLPSTQPVGTAIMVDRIFRLLASYSILNCKLVDGQRLYGLAPFCKFLTKNSDGVSMAPRLLTNHDKIDMEFWYHLKDAILEGGNPFNRAHGMMLFEYTEKDPRYNRLFNRGMSNHSTITMKKILQIYNGFDGLGTLLDVGGGTGATLSIIISKYPQIKGINFDHPHVVKDLPSYPGVQHVGGDMFASVPKADAIFMKWICHDWSDEQCLKLLKNCYEALPNNGKVIIAEYILPEVPDSKLTTKDAMVMDILMMAKCPGGKERSEKEFEALAKDAGFNNFTKACCAYSIWIMELHK